MTKHQAFDPAIQCGLIAGFSKIDWMNSSTSFNFRINPQPEAIFVIIDNLVLRRSAGKPTLQAAGWVLEQETGILGCVRIGADMSVHVTIIPFMPDGWAPSAGGFPAMVGNGAFLMRDLVLLAVSFYLLEQDVVRVTHAAKHYDLVMEPDKAA
jgi:Protein of unknown function, DUF417